jgi:hypothetical protein
MTTETEMGTSLGTDRGSENQHENGEDTGTKERAQQAAATAADEGKHVAGVAAEEARSVAGEARDHARNLVGEARSQLQGQVDEQSRQQKDVLASTLGTFGDDLASMAENGSGLAADVAHEVAERARSLSQHLGDREPSELLDDVRRFARQRPGTFLLGALAAGVVVGRLARGTKDAIEAADGAPAAGANGVSSSSDETRRVTPGAPDTTSAHASHGQPTQPPIEVGPASSTGYSSPPVGTGLPGSPTDAPQGGLTS